MRILTLSESEIKQEVFSGAKADEPRCLLDGFSEEEVCALPRHPEWPTFDMRFRDWIWETIDSILFEDCE